MKQRNLIILKGVSGSGKSTFANLIAYPCCVCTADDYFTDKDGNYNFEVNKMGLAHKACQSKFDDALKDDIITNIVIANTNTKPADYKYYVDKAEKAGLRITYVVLENRNGTKDVHNVPEETLQRQEKTLRDNLQLR
jgi:predicted kinase